MIVTAQEILGLPAPTLGGHATNKTYVDAQDVTYLASAATAAAAALPNVTIGATASGLSVAAGQVLSLALAVAGGANGALLGTDKTKLDAISGSNSGDVTLAAIGSTANANGASLSGQVLTLQPASASFGGILTAGAQTIAGAKNFAANTTIGGASGVVIDATNFRIGLGGTPAYALDFGTNSANTQLALYNNGSSIVGFGISAGDFRAHLDLATSQFSWRPTPAGSPIMSLSGTGTLTLTGPLAGVTTLAVSGKITSTVASGSVALQLTAGAIVSLNGSTATCTLQSNGDTYFTFPNSTDIIFQNGSLVEKGRVKGTGGFFTNAGPYTSGVGGSANAIVIQSTHRIHMNNNSGSIYLAYDATNFVFTGAPVSATKMVLGTGAAGSSGTATLSAGTVTVSTTAVTANSLICLTHKGTGVLANLGILSQGTIVAGTSFVINSSNVVDNDTVSWFLVN